MAAGEASAISRVTTPTRYGASPTGTMASRRSSAAKRAVAAMVTSMPPSRQIRGGEDLTEVVSEGPCAAQANLTSADSPSVSHVFVRTKDKQVSISLRMLLASSRFGIAPA